MATKAGETRTRVLEAAARLFAERGLEAVSIQDIRDASGVSNGSIFHHFGSKNGVALHVYLDERRAYWEHAIAAVEAHDGDPVDALGAAVRATLAYQQEHPERHNFMIECASSTWTRAHAEPVQALNAEFTTRFIAWGAPHVMAGRLRPIDPQLVAALVFGPSQWLARSWLTGLTPEPPTHYADMLVDLVTRALRPDA
ncbi:MULTISPECIES: TetR/AcrR family transcriptional regulator [unclassified Sphingomonas]|uniref:TetR/AcrR family transcriptional regulator n=1 Tax=unclassified Sphingomonas TaxID=196159 RepID=UPI002150A16D|nr:MULTISPECIES: TetR/AcrR family transcriptional regulator [unclassified Sphingomonas]MCR5871601.1 TetR/AcrR family transcriptional regulator [Sphingomonas sp. J344]UUY00106.1 TetR/AcrR family transcriptional regulator [Sphingomonas sp. J315]